MDILKTWIITLVSVTLLCTIIEKFAPQGSLNKYVRLVCGLAVTVIIAMPVLNFLKGDYKFESLAWNEYMKLSEGELQKRIKSLERENSEQMLEIYRQSLISDIKSRFLGEGEFMVRAADAVLYENAEDENYGMLRALYLTLEPAGDNREKTLKKEAISRIRSELSQVFSLEEDKIFIDSSLFTGGGKDV